MLLENLPPKSFVLGFGITFYQHNKIVAFEEIFKSALKTVEYHSKIYPNSNCINDLHIRLTLDYSTFDSVLSVMVEHFQRIAEDVSEFFGINIFVEYSTRAQILISHQNLIQLYELFGDEFSVGVNSFVLNWPPEREVYDQEEYYQIIIGPGNNYSLALKEFLIGWTAPLQRKYRDLIAAEFITNDSGSYFYLSLKGNIRIYSWNEQFQDMLDLLETKPKDLAATFGYYQQNRGSMFGGELGRGIISQVKSLKVDLLLSCGFPEFYHFKASKRLKMIDEMEGRQVLVGNLNPKSFVLSFSITFYEFDKIAAFEKMFKSALKAVEYHSKIYPSSDYPNDLYVRLIFDYGIFDSVLSVMVEHFQRIAEDVSEFSGINIYLNYNTRAQILIRHQNLIQLYELFGEFFSIGMDSVTLDWSDEWMAHPREEYYQIIIGPENNFSLALKEFLIEWTAPLQRKYRDLIAAEFITNDSGSYFYLSLKRAIDVFLWNDQFQDMLNLLASKPKDLVTTFGFYQRNRNRMRGGEVNSEIMSQLTSVKLDLLLSFGLPEFFID